MSVQLGDLATWVASVGTVAAVSVALWQILSERKERLGREFREQAERVSAWYAGSAPGKWPDSDTRIELLNSSNEPVYEVVAGIAFIQGAAPHSGEEWMQLEDHSIMGGFGKALGALPPGRWAITVPGGWGAMMARPGAEIAFTDRSGSHWVRRATGKLEQLHTNAVDHYKISRPVDYQAPEPLTRPEVKSIDTYSARTASRETVARLRRRKARDRNRLRFARISPLR
jgi:hypothetical protein